MRFAKQCLSAVRPAIRLCLLLLAWVVITQLGAGGAVAQSPAPPPAPPGSGGTTFGSVRVLAGNELPRNAGQENQPPVWLTVDTKGASAVVTIGNATRVKLSFTGTVVLSLAPGAQGVQVLVSTGTATIQGNQIVWTGFSLDSTQIMPAIVTLATSGGASPAVSSASAISEISVEARDQSGAAVTERAAGGGPTLTALASAPANATSPAAAQPGAAGAAGIALSRATARTLGAWALVLAIAVLAGLIFVAWLVYATGRRLERELRAAAPFAPAAGAPSEPYAGGTVTQSPGQAMAGAHRASAVPLSPGPVARLEAIEGTDTGRIWILQREDMSVGRNDGNDIVVTDRTVSERHARLTRTPDGGYLVSDNGSTNGTQVNGEPVTAQRLLVDGDELRIGNLVLIFHASVREPV